MIANHKFLFVILPIALVISIIIFFLFTSRANEYNFSIRDTIENYVGNNSVNTLSYEIPPLPDLIDGEWKTEIVEEKSPDILFYVRDANGNNWSVDQVNGTSNITTIEVSELDEEITNFISQYFDYTNSLHDNGWRSQIYIENYELTLSAMVADGPMGSAQGYFAPSEGKLKYILASYAVDFNFDPETDELYCPCKIELSVFESDPIVIDEILSYN